VEEQISVRKFVTITFISAEGGEIITKIRKQKHRRRSRNGLDNGRVWYCEFYLFIVRFLWERKANFSENSIQS